jgi:hypothetical protein
MAAPCFSILIGEFILLYCSSISSAMRLGMVGRTQGMYLSSGNL